MDAAVPQEESRRLRVLLQLARKRHLDPPKPKAMADIDGMDTLPMEFPEDFFAFPSQVV